MYAERLLRLLPEDFYKRIIVHEHYYLKNEFGLGGIHIESPNEPLPEKYKGKFSRTCMDLSLLKEAKKKSEYVFLKYIFDSQSEPEAKSTFNMSDLQAAAKNGLIDKHVYALGGMNLDTIKIAKDLGFGGIVICGDLWNRFDIHYQQDYKDLVNHFQTIRKAIG